MESASLASGFLKNRRFGSYFDASSGSVLDSDRPREVVVANEKREEVYGDDDGWVIMLISWIRMLICVVMWILGNPITIEGLEYSEETAIYISNHASLIDIFLIMWLTPTGTVGVAKKEIIWYLFIGQLYVLANHLRIDRSNPAAAIESMKEKVTDGFKPWKQPLAEMQGLCALGIANTASNCSNCNDKHSSSMEEGQPTR
ncbi:1-acyl-sn-glycerol-3-phosphate acyltransferase [Capsicum chinense]|nr:1-acyl-sn-glycerol-3-phosphate acyltransferase [Capsicum chinense]